MSLFASTPTAVVTTTRALGHRDVARDRTVTVAEVERLTSTTGHVAASAAGGAHDTAAVGGEISVDDV